MFGGFHPQDVVNYISKKNKEYREELEALRFGADKLRRERDALLASQNEAQPAPAPAAPPEPVYVPLVAEPAVVPESAEIVAPEPVLREQIAPEPEIAPVAVRDNQVVEELNIQLEGLRSQLDERRVQFYEMCRERDELCSKLEALTLAQEEERGDLEKYRREREAFEGDRASLLDAITRSEEEKAELANERAAWFTEKAELIQEKESILLAMEQAGASREQIKKEEEESARRIEEVKSQAAAVRAETAKLISQSRAFFDEMNEKSRNSALEIVLELDRMRGFFAKFPERFADPGQILSKLESDPRPYLREFKPQVFETAEEESAVEDTAGTINDPPGEAAAVVIDCTPTDIE
jgi:hypothetical protein